MDRRQFLTAAAATGTAGLIPGRAFAQIAGDPINGSFEAALKERPWLVGLQSAEGDREVGSLQVEGRWPAALRGSFFRNGPAKHDRAGMRYHHWFDGDGMVHRYRIEDGTVSYRARFVRSPKFVAEEQAGRFLYDAGGTRIPGARGGSTAELNVANTSVLPVGDSLWALWEGGSPTALDPVTLETRGPVDLSDALKRAPFSAHPRVGSDGRIWNIGMLGSKLALYRLNARGRVEGFKLIDVPEVGMMHDFFLTERSVVILLPSADMKGSGESFFGMQRSRRDLPMQLIVADRETLTVTRRAEVPSGYWFHGGNAWEERDGTIRFDVCLLPDATIMNRFRAFMAGETRHAASDYAGTTLFTIRPDGRVESRRVAGHAEFPAIDRRFGTLRNRYVYSAEKHQGHTPWYDSVRRVDLEGGSVERFTYAADHLVEEHLFVPRPGSTREGQGWLLGTTLHWPSRRTMLNLLDAERLADGPVARAWLPMPAPLGFHGAWAA